MALSSMKARSLERRMSNCMQDVDNILKRLKSDLKSALEDKIGDLILFGSYSRGDNTQYSDIDLLILVNSRLTRDETRKVDDLIAGYSLENDIVISGLVYPVETYHRFNTPFLLNIKEEGILV
jgi:predicted nucleotidyltransferase